MYVDRDIMICMKSKVLKSKLIYFLKVYMFKVNRSEHKVIVADIK